MNEFIQHLSERTGLDAATAEKATNYLRTNAAALGEKLKSGTVNVEEIAQQMGIDREHADKVVSYLRDHGHQTTQWLGDAGRSLSESVKGYLGKVLK